MREIPCRGAINILLTEVNPDGRDCCRSTWCSREAGQTCLAWGSSPFHSELRTRSPVLAAEGASKVETSRVVAWATPLAALSLRCSHCIWLLGFDRRHSLHESHPMGSVHCGGSVRGSRRYHHFDGYGTPSLVQHGPGGRLQPPRTAIVLSREGGDTTLIVSCDFPDVGSHLVAKEQRAVRIVPIWICASST